MEYAVHLVSTKQLQSTIDSKEKRNKRQKDSYQLLSVGNTIHKILNRTQTVLYACVHSKRLMRLPHFLAIQVTISTPHVSLLGSKPITPAPCVVKRSMLQTSRSCKGI